MKKKLSCLFLSLLLLIGLTGCGEARFLNKDEIADYTNDEIKGTIYITYYNTQIRENVEIELPFTLYYRSAPNTVANFYALVKSGEYENTLVNSPNSANEGYNTDGITMGSTYYGFEKDEDGKDTTEIDYSKEATKDIGYKIKGEFKKNGWEVDAADDKSDVRARSMYMVLADSANYDSASIGFGIATKDDDNIGKNSALGRTICVFGEVEDTTEFADLILNSSKIDFGGNENHARITKIEIDGEYNMKLIKA